jgi:sialate O-acetylesterase
MNRSKLTFIIIFIGRLSSVYANLALNGIFKDNMVLQCDQKVSVYGTDIPSSRVTVHFGEQQKSTITDESGRWELKLDPMKKSFNPQKLVVNSDEGKEQVTISNVVVGDVWLCSGQSNMERWFGLYPLLKEKAGEINNPDIRGIILEKQDAAEPQDSVILRKMFVDAWHEAKDPYVMQFSPTTYFFAEKLRRDLDIPVGLIISAVGGTQIQRWMPHQVVNGLNLDSESRNGAGLLYNAMIHPLRKFTIRGVIWYQGESNGRIPHSYYALSKEHIESWRQVWAQNNPHLKDMPFFTVQIAPFQTTVDGLASDAWAFIRDAQLKTLSLPNTGLVVTTDLGEYADIHPQNKQPVGERLALWAEKLEGRSVVPSGPLFKKAVVDGNKINVYFSYVDSGLEARRVAISSRKNVWAKDDPNAYVASADNLAGFTLCGPDMKFIPAEAKIIGDHVEVSSKEISNPVAVRYGWSTFPLCNLYNKEGLPASPFRSDVFPVPDVQGRTVGITWDGNDTTLGYALEFTGSTDETAWLKVSEVGREGFQPQRGQDLGPCYAYYKIAEQNLKSGRCPEVVLSIIYFDQGDGNVAIQYDSSDKDVLVVKENPGAWKNGGNLKIENTLTWKKAEFTITDGLFDGRCNGADFRLNCPQSFIFSKLYCRKI